MCITTDVTLSAIKSRLTVVVENNTRQYYILISLVLHAPLAASVGCYIYFYDIAWISWSMPSANKERNQTIHTIDELLLTISNSFYFLCYLSILTHFSSPPTFPIFQNRSNNDLPVPGRKLGLCCRIQYILHIGLWEEWARLKFWSAYSMVDAVGNVQTVP